MDEYKDDGEIHPLDQKYGYILKFFKEKPEMLDSLTNLKYLFISKYAEYIFRVNKKKSLKYLTEFLYQNPPEDLEFIFRPSNIHSALNEKSSFGLKFLRFEGDEIFFND